MTVTITTTGRTVNVFEPADGRGKWHALWRVTRTPRCGATVVEFSEHVIAVPPGTPHSQVHRVVCRKCLHLAGSPGYAATTV